MAQTFDNIHSFNAYMKGVIGFIVNDMLGAAEVNGNTGATLLSQRISDTGKKGDNKKIGKYAPSTKKRKEREGKLSSFVNLQNSEQPQDQMWGNFGVVENSIQGKVIKTIVSGTNEFSNEKLGWNADRYGDFLTLTKTEEKMLAKAFDSELQIILNKYF